MPAFDEDAFDADAFSEDAFDMGESESDPDRPLTCTVSRAVSRPVSQDQTSPVVAQ